VRFAAAPKPIGALGALLLLLSLSPACAVDFAPASLLDEARILALIPNPIEIDLTDPSREIELHSVLHLPATATITSSRWSFCPISSGVRGGFACVLPACQIELTEVETGRVSVSPAGLAADCLERLGGEGIELLGMTGEPPESVETSFLHRVETDESAPIEAVARVRAYLRNAPRPAREHPRFVRVSIDRQIVGTSSTAPRVGEGESLEIEVQLEPGVGSTANELYVSYYATAGRFLRLRTDQALGQNTWTAEELDPEDQSSTLYFVVRDGKGGQAVAGPVKVQIDQKTR
jgi:hypothetical protein